MILQFDKLDSATFDRVGFQYRIVRTGIITGMDASRPETVMGNALQCPGLPQLNDPHPVFGQCLVTEHHFRPLTDSQIKVQVVYESPVGGDGGGSLYVVGETTTLAQFPADFDADGAQLEVDWNLGKKNADGSGAGVQKAFQAQRLVKMVNLVAGQHIIGQVPQAVKDAVGKINSKAWRGGGAGEWMLSSLDSTTRDRGVSYDVQYQFTRNPLTWDVVHVIQLDKNITPLGVDPIPPHPDAVNGPAQSNKNGVTRAVLYDSVDFGSLFKIPDGKK